MKALKSILILILTVSIGTATTYAQTTKKDKKAARLATIKTSVEARKYTFMANYVVPQRGGGRALNDTYYDLRVTPDSVISYLPYFGRAYFDVPYASTDGGIKFTSTKFDYKVTNKKDGSWEITIKPGDVKNMNNITLSISQDGYATLGISTFNRDYISFYGNLKE
jgi:hypothetical protein